MTFAPSISPAHAATLTALAGLSPLDAIARLHAMPKALSAALCVSCGVDREVLTWASDLHSFAVSFGKAGGPSTTRSGMAKSCA